MNYIRNLYTVFGLFILATMHSGAHAHGSIYHQELQSLKKSKFFKTILNRRSPIGLRAILKDLENVNELGLFSRVGRFSLLFQGGLVVTQESMPQLYGYVDTLCKQHNIPTPTIFITAHKSLWPFNIGKYFETGSIKLFTSTGGILLSQDLIKETSQTALEAAIAYEIARIKYNHTNKWLLTFSLLAITQPFGEICMRMLVGKQFDKQADRFVYKTANNAEGLIDFCTYLQNKEKQTEDDYADTYTAFQTKTAKPVFLYIDYCLLNAGHKLHNSFKWLFHNTPITQYQSNKKRIRTAQRYLDTQKALQTPTD